jgi:hypothetical protein
VQGAYWRGWRHSACLDAKTRILAVGVLVSTTDSNLTADLLLTRRVPYHQPGAGLAGWAKKRGVLPLRLAALPPPEERPQRVVLPLKPANPQRSRLIEVLIPQSGRWMEQSIGPSEANSRAPRGVEAMGAAKCKPRKRVQKGPVSPVKRAHGGKATSSVGLACSMDRHYKRFLMFEN